MMPDLSSVSTDDLLNEIRRRIPPDGACGPSVGGEVGNLPLSLARNAARQQIAQALQRGLRPPMAIAILELLTANGTPQTMADIIGHMRQRGFKSRTFYDAANALAEMRLAERVYQGTDISWRITPSGQQFLEQI